MKVAIEKLQPYKWQIVYSLILIFMALSYLPAREVMKVQTAWIWVIKSTITMNFVVLFFVYGVLCDKLTKHMSKKNSWLAWVGGLVALILFMRLLGMETIFG